MTEANLRNPIVPISQTIYVKAGEVDGQAIALQHDGNQMIYLVVLTKGNAAPVWVAESEIEKFGVRVPK